MQTAAMTDAWVDEVRDKRADVIKVIRDGVLIEVGDLPRPIRQKIPQCTQQES